MWKELGNFVEQVFILRNARGCGIFGEFGETGVAFGDVIEVLKKNVIGTLFDTVGMVEWVMENLGNLW